MEIKVIEPKKQKTKQKEKLKVAAYARVSTASTEQEDSFENQVKYYTEKICSNNDYEFVGIYADQAISGTTDKRPEFQRMIADAKKGKIDLIITKSISRFSRNVGDLSKYVQLLKNLDVDVLFEEDNIRLQDERSSLLLNILASVAQMEVENTSSHINWTLQEKMKRGELVGQPNPLGYDVVDGKLVINEEEAKVVKFIFARYLAGVGCHRLTKELEQMGAKTKRGATRWHDSSITKILTNEKYVGTLLQGKTTTVNPIGHVRKVNDGLARQYVQEDAHEAIISREDFDRVQEIVASRTVKDKDGRKRFSTSNANFSCFTGKIECFFCGKHFVRRTVHAGTKYQKLIWQCATYAKRGKVHCPDSKPIDEDVIKAAFMRLIKHLFYDRSSVFTLSSDSFEDYIKEAQKAQFADEQRLSSIEKQISKLMQRQSALVDLLLDSAIDKATYDEKRAQLISEIDTLNEERLVLRGKQSEKQRELRDIRDVHEILSNPQQAIEYFDERLFTKLVKKVTIGGIRPEDNTVDPRMIGFELNIEYIDYTKDYEAKLQAEKESMVIESEEQNNVEQELYSPYTNHSCGVYSGNTKTTLDYLHRDWIRMGSRASHYEENVHTYDINIKIE